FDVFAGKKSAQIREILISESAWEEMTCLFAPSLDYLWRFTWSNDRIRERAFSSFWELNSYPKLRLIIVDRWVD
ncbi:TPA: hypothetical protein ACF5U8_004723, partial [Escherichia coli]